MNTADVANRHWVQVAGGFGGPGNGIYIFKIRLNSGEQFENTRVLHG